MDRVALAVEKIRRLALEVAADRQYTHKPGDISTSHTGGISLLDPSEAHVSQSAANQKVNDSLFVDGDEESDNLHAQEFDGDYVDHGYVSEEEADSVVDLIAWVNSLAVPVKKLHRPSDINRPSPCPGLIIEPRDHQYRALGLIERTSKTEARTLLIGDPPGLGKTLPGMMAIVKSKPSARRYSIIVAPAGCLDQWASEFNRFFAPGTLKVLVLRDSSVPPTTLLQYDAIICSYNFVMYRHQKRVQYLERMKVYKTTRDSAPERPNLSLFSEIFEMNPEILSPFLILDEVNAVKNHNSKSFAAILELRQMAHTCVMLTGSPIDNQWHDIYAFIQLVQGHDLRSRMAMLRLVAEPSTKHPGRFLHPQGFGFLMLVQILDSFILRRPESTISLPPLTKKVRKFELSKNEAEQSNKCFRKYLTAISISSSERGKGEDQGTAFKSLTHALQHASHPQLVKLMEFIRTRKQVDEGDDDVLHDAASIEYWNTWRQNMGQDDAWRSSRIDATIESFNEQRDLDPDCSVVVFDESVYFLDIVQCAFEHMYDPVQVLRYDGRLAPENRSAILTEFKESKGSKVLLMSRAAGGVGLNIPFANVVIQCAPWWKSEWEDQAYKRVWRSGQDRAVTYVVLQAEKCMAETYKAKARDKKHRFNSKVVKAITRNDGEEPVVSNNFQ